MKTIFVNGKTVELCETATLRDLLSALPPPGQPFAVAVNETFVPRGLYGHTALTEGDRVELVVASQGG